MGPLTAITIRRLGGVAMLVAAAAPARGESDQTPPETVPNHIFFVKHQNFSSIAGSAGRPDSNFFLVTPTYIHTISPSWWYLVDGETKTDWERSNTTRMRGGLQVGTRLAAAFRMWVKPEAAWIPNQDKQWNRKFGLVWLPVIAAAFWSAGTVEQRGSRAELARRIPST